MLLVRVVELSHEGGQEGTGLRSKPVALGLKTVVPVTCAQQRVKMICNRELEKWDFEKLNVCIYTFAFREVLQSVS